MRMVYPAATDEVFYPARDRLVRTFQQWARRQRRPVDAFVVEALLDHRWADGDGLLNRWQPADLREALCEWFPRKVTLAPGEWRTVVPTVQAFVEYLFAADLADERCADRDELHAALDGLADEFDSAMGDQTRYGLAKYWSMRMLAAGVDPTDGDATQRFLADLHSGRIPVDRGLLDQLMANHLDDHGGKHPPLPVVALPDDATLAALADESVALRRMREFVSWVGSGRELTKTGRLRLADARELISLLGTADVIDPQIGGRVFRTATSEELYELSVTFAWAKAARVARVVKGRLLPVKSARGLLLDPGALARRAFAGFFALGEVVCGAGYSASMIRWAFDDVTFAVVMALYLAQRPVPTSDLHQIALEAAGQPLVFDDPSHGDLWQSLCGHDVDRLLAQLATLGAVHLTDTAAALTPLGLGLVAGHLRGLGVTVPSLDDLVEETAEVVVAAAADAAPDLGETLLGRWCERHAATAPADLRALAARTDDPTHRRLAASFARTADQGRPRAARGSGLAAGVVELGGRLRREIGR